MNTTTHTTATAGTPSPNAKAAALLGWFALCFSASVTGLFIAPGGWYDSLEKPGWTPQSWVFGPAWMILYVLMAFAAWLVWIEGGWRVQGRALGLFAVQLALNALWTSVFFGLHKPGLAFAEIVVLWLAIAATLTAFLRVRKLAAMLLVPYLAWVTFAAALNFAIWRMNR